MDNLQCSEEISKPGINENKSIKKQDPETLDFNNFSLLKDPKQFLTKVQELNQLGIDKMRNQQFQQSVKVLCKAEELLSLGRSTCRNVSDELKISVYYNLACAYQGAWNLQKCNKFCQTTSDQIENILKNTEIQNKQKIIKYNLQLLKLKLQHCAILSQLGQHQKAYEMSKFALRILKQCLEQLYDFTKTLKPSEIQEYSGYRDRVTFSSTVAKSTALLGELLSDLQTEIQAKKIQKKPFFYFWKNNPENNEKHIKQQFSNKKKFSRQEQSRSILGLQNENEWIQQFNIGTIMHMTPFSEKEMMHIPSFFQQLTKKNIYEKVIYSSVLHFTIATEIRFIQIQIQKEKEPKTNKYVNEIKSQAYLLSELYHLKAIQIMCKGITTCSPYLNHLISSYHKHYVQSLKSIEQHQQSYISEILQQPKHKINSNQFQQNNTEHNEDYYNKNKHLNVSQEGVETDKIQKSSIKEQIENARIKIEKLKNDNDDESTNKTLKKQKRKSQPAINNNKSTSVSKKKGRKDQNSSSNKKKKTLKQGKKKQKSPENINLIDCKNTKSGNKIQLSIIKKAFNSRNFKTLQPNQQILLTQKTSTEINVIVKKKNPKS